MNDDATVYRVQFSSSSARIGDLAQSVFAHRLKLVGAMIIHGNFPSPVTIGATRRAAARIAELPFVGGVDAISD
ncbi:hypothetical protein [Nocardia arizonensis]|uniref:hypothetical protein n=1 Tax=Nocardia arizonensis TaxID=1141647 RepID=UPI0006D0E2D4|nr:hypothetical protein [Nocardia arizonensis]